MVNVMNTKEIRKQARLEKLGTNNPLCVICGEDDWRCLEEHHIAGQAFGEDLVTVCRNCHRKLSDDQYDHPKKLTPVPCQIERAGHLLLGVADLFEPMVKRFRIIGQELIQASKQNSKK